MNVTCPDCTTTYRVDPAKVPSGGILAQCARCPAIFRVEEVAERELEQTSAQGSFAAVGEFESSEGEPSPEFSDMAFETGAPPQESAALVGDDFPSQREEEPGADQSWRAGWSGEADEEVESDAELDAGYSGASDVAFHADTTPLEDLPYLEAPRERTSTAWGEADLAENLPASGESWAAAEESQAGEESPIAPEQESRLGAGQEPLTESAQESATPEVQGAFSGSGVEPPAESGQERPTESGQESTIESGQEPPPAAPGETPLPPAPFGAGSDPHRRAARLARALVSDIVVYHPERRTRSLRQGTLRQEFREEIRKSWEEYANQVGSDFARQTTYFKDALNEILAEGATVF